MINGYLTSVIITLAVLAAAILVLILVFVKSLKKTLYAYKNVNILAGLGFLAVIFAEVLINLIGYSHDRSSSQDLLQNLIKIPQHFAYIALPVMTIVCLFLGISNIVLIRKEGFCIQNALSIAMAVIFLGGTGIALAISIVMNNNLVAQAGALYYALRTYVPLFFLLIICYLECIFIATCIMSWAAAIHKPALDKDYIIILGCSIDKRGGLLPLLKGRTNRAIKFAWEQEIAGGSPVYYVPSGGQGKNEIMSEGSAMELYLLSHGAESNEVFPEKESRSTLENMIFSKRIIDKLKPDAKVAFATTNYHVFRSGIYAIEAGLDAEGIGSSTKWYFWPNGFIREFFAMVVANKKEHLAAFIICLLICAVGFICEMFV